MHNRKPDGILSREISLKDGLVLAPLVLCIVGLAFYPQLILKRSDESVQGTIAAVCGPVRAFSADPHLEIKWGREDGCPGGNDARTREVEIQRISSAPNKEGWTGYAPLASTGGGTQ
jgi:hypothetical protein